MKRIIKRIGYSCLILASIVVIILFGNNIYNQLKHHQIEMQNAKDEAMIYRLKEHIVERLLKAQQDTVFVAAYLEDYTNGDNVKNDIGYIATELSKIVPSLMNANNILSGLYYIESNNSNSVFVNAQGVVDKKQPDTPISKDCYLATSKLKKEEVHIDFDSSSIYISSPVYNESKALAGIILMVVDEEGLINELQQVISDANIILMDDTGDYILASDKHNGIENFTGEYAKDQLNEILQSGAGGSINGSNNILTFVSADLGDHQWYIVLDTDKESVTAVITVLYFQFITVLTLAVLSIFAAVIFWLGSYRKDQIAKKDKALNKQLEEVNGQLRTKQYSLEEQNSLIEELNSQLADENDRYLKQRDLLEVTNTELLENKYILERQNIVIEELNSKLGRENQKYLQQKNILQAIIDSLGAGIIMVDPSGKIVFINKAWRDLFHYNDSNQNKELFKHFYIDDNSFGEPEKFIKDAMTGIENSDYNAIKLINLIKDDKNRYNVDLEQESPVKRFLNLYSNPCNSVDDINYGRVYVVRDVSHQKEVDRLKLELISTVSHELRTPMSSILGFSELLLTRKLPEERSREYISIINSEAMRLTELINDFLDIQRMESGKQIYNKQYDYIDQIIEEAVKIFADTSSKHNIIFDKDLEDHIKIFCDRNKILQVLSNLISNAIKYSPDGGDVKISLKIDNGRVRVSVADNGLGIPGNARDKLFSKFFRVDNDDRREIGGSGLGLAICKEIVQAHGGEVGVESIYGQGSTFYFYLPYSINSEITGNTINYDNVSDIMDNHNLLIIEDDASTVILIKEILKEEGLQITDVGSGEEALSLMKMNRYKLILLDITLNGHLNGWDVLRELKNITHAADTPIIICSVREDKLAESQDNLVNYLVKPFEAEHLIMMVRSAIKGNEELTNE